MKRETFNYLCDKLRLFITHQNTRFRRAISVEQRVAITLWCLATPCEYSTVTKPHRLLQPKGVVFDDSSSNCGS